MSSGPLTIPPTTMNSTKYTKRSLLRITLEAVTPLAIGSGEKTLVTDQAVALDVNGLPYIPGTGVAGVIRSIMPELIDVDRLFGFQDSNNGQGSRVMFTEGKILDSNGCVADGYTDMTADSLLRAYANLPVRQHVRIGHKGTGEEHGKFDNQVVYAGSRFCFEIETLLMDGEDDVIMPCVIEAINGDTLRLGGGTRDGFGKGKVVELKSAMIDLTKKDELDCYLSKSSNLADSANWNGWKEEDWNNGTTSNDYTIYKLSLNPRDMFMFGSGYGDEDVDMVPVSEPKVVWNNNANGLLSKGCTLVPATSVKGALRHRVAYHYNKIKGWTVENGKGQKSEDNDAVKALFGSLTGSNDGKQTRGCLLFEDLYVEDLGSHILNHVMVDRFTGGTIEGALFSEKPTVGMGTTINMNIVLTHAIADRDVEEALDKAICDIKNGLLPLGGSVNRGNGLFSGTCVKFKNGEETAL